jgi:acyl-CoA thioester hydrolase
MSSHIPNRGFCLRYAIGDTAMTERRIYYKDTDAGGIIYYVNYLRYLEQGRNEFLRARGLSIRTLHEQGYLIPVMRLEIDYLQPALLYGIVRVETAFRDITGATCTMGQQVVRVSDGAMLVDAKVMLACLVPGDKSRRLPRELM